MNLYWKNPCEDAWRHLQNHRLNDCTSKAGGKPITDTKSIKINAYTHTLTYHQDILCFNPLAELQISDNKMINEI